MTQRDADAEAQMRRAPEGRPSNRTSCHDGSVVVGVVAAVVVGTARGTTVTAMVIG